MCLCLAAFEQDYACVRETEREKEGKDYYNGFESMNFLFLLLQSAARSELM